MATTQQKNFYAEQLLPLIGTNAARLPNQAITGFLSMAGHLYNNELMVVGRAVNGWAEGVLPAVLSTPASAGDYAATIFDSVVGNGSCPMSWVTNCWANPSNPDSKYNTKKSAFWRVIRAVVAESGIANTDEDTWPSHLVWSNLYKVAPEGGGNPGGVLRQVQLNECISLLQQEFDVYLPRRLLLLTGLDWAEPFLRHIAPTFSHVRPGSYVEATAEILQNAGGSTSVVVAAHPQGKSESIWVREVIQAFQRSGCVAI